MQIGIAFDLKSDHQAAAGAPEDALEEFDSIGTIEALERALALAGHTPVRLGSGRNFISKLLASPPELVFNISEGSGSRSREAHVPAVCEALKIACTHSDPLTMAVSLDKAVAKRLVSSLGIATARFAVVERPQELAHLGLPYPLFAKPLYEGSSMGIRKRSRARDAGELAQLVGQLLDDYGEPVLVEEFLPGAEFTVGILGQGARAHAIGVMEVVPLQVPTHEFVYSLEVKRNWNWSEEVAYHVPPKRPAAQVRAIEEVALASYRALGVRDVGRIDVRLDQHGTPRFLEANPLPGVAPGWSDLALLCERANMSYDTLIARILEEALERTGLAAAGAQRAR